MSQILGGLTAARNRETAYKLADRLAPYLKRLAAGEITIDELADIEARETARALAELDELERRARGLRREEQLRERARRMRVLPLWRLMQAAPGLTPAALDVLAALVQAANVDRRAQISRSRLMTRSGRSHATIPRAMRALERAGLVVRGPVVSTGWARSEVRRYELAAVCFLPRWRPAAEPRSRIDRGCRPSAVTASPRLPLADERVPRAVRDSDTRLSPRGRGAVGDCTRQAIRNGGVIK